MTGFEAHLRENTDSEIHADWDEVCGRGSNDNENGQTETHGHRGFSSKLTPKRSKKL